MAIDIWLRKHHADGEHERQLEQPGRAEQRSSVCIGHTNIEQATHVVSIYPARSMY